ncbi:MAG: restriction endonuclease fold toxin 5 domain-containing protein [Gammaproteobacteria bacterium]
MASLAVPVLEAAGVALLRALGVTAAAGAGAVAINEAAKKKADAADKAKAAPIAQAATQTKTRDRCSKCQPDCGALVQRNWSMSEDSRSYQARITGFSPGTEWNFDSTDFDGFRSQTCTLLEAKARYDQFFDATGDPKIFFRIVGIPKINSQAIRQNIVVVGASPAQLQWHFMQPLSWAYFARSFRRAFLSITTVLTP